VEISRRPLGRVFTQRAHTNGIVPLDAADCGNVGNVGNVDCGFQIVLGQPGATTATGRDRTAAGRQTVDGPGVETARAPAGEDRHVHSGRRLDLRRGATRTVPHRAGRVVVPLQAWVRPTQTPRPVSQYVSKAPRPELRTPALRLRP